MSFSLGSMSCSYTDHLQLDQYRTLLEAPEIIKEVESPLVVDKWASQLQDHPDQQFAVYILEGISKGFRIGFQYSSHVTEASCVNLVSAFQNPEVVTEYLKMSRHWAESSPP